MSDDLEMGDLNDCPCNEGAEGAKAVTRAPMKYVRKQPPKLKRPRSKGVGDYCVLSHKGTVVHCYESETTAKRVADAFTRRGRAGTEFRVTKKR